MGAEGLDNNIPQATVRIDGSLVGLLAGFGQLIAGDVQLDLLGELLARKGFEARNAISGRAMLVVGDDDGWKLTRCECFRLCKEKETQKCCCADWKPRRSGRLEGRCGW